MPQRRFTDNQAKEMRDLHQKGWSIPKLNKKFAPDDCSDNMRHIIRQILCGDTYKNAGGVIGIIPFSPKSKTSKPRQVKLTQETKDEIKALWNDGAGMSQGAIMRELADNGIEVSRSYISRIIKGTR